jgi:hypothetical protein
MLREACRCLPGPWSMSTFGLAFAEFKGYERWQTISPSHNGTLLAVILGSNGKTEPGHPLIAGTLHDIDFMVKDRATVHLPGL